MSVIDVIRTSASRPELFKASTRSLKEGLLYSGKLRWLMHENYLDREASKEIVRFAKESGLYEEILEADPSIGQGMALTRLLKRTRARYVFNFEDDWEIVRPIDLDAACRLMDENPGIHQIVFNKRDTMRDVNEFKKLEVDFSGTKLVTCPHWRLTPALWRVSFIWPWWAADDSGNFHWNLNDRMKGSRKMRDAEWVVRHTGTYYMGKFDEKQFVRHLGTDQSARLKNAPKDIS